MLLHLAIIILSSKIIDEILDSFQKNQSIIFCFIFGVTAIFSPAIS